MGSEGEPESKKPARGIAILLSLAGPWGIGQYYLGRTRRAVLWLALPLVALLLFALLLQPVGELVGYGNVLALLVCGTPLAWVASVLDVLAVPEARTTPVRKVAVVGFWLTGFLSSLVLGSVVRAYLIEAYKIPSGSMQPTLLVDDHVMVDKRALRTRTPKRGELVVFQLPESPEQVFIKRAIAVPSDTLELKGGRPWLNGWEVPHCVVGKATLPDTRPGCSGTLDVEYLEGEAYLVFFDDCAASDRKLGPYLVGPDEVWVLGDNRNNSFDSPAWFGGRGGGVPLDHVKGRGLFRW